MTLSIKLIRDIVKEQSCTKFEVCMSNGLVARALTNRRTDRTDSITSTNIVTALVQPTNGNPWSCHLIGIFAWMKGKECRDFDQLIIACILDYLIRLLTDMKISDEESARQAMQKLHEMGARTVVISSSDLGNDDVLVGLGSTVHSE